MLEHLITNRVLVSAVVSWAIAQILKVLIELIRHHRLEIKWLVNPGGMPSSHSAIVTALAISAGIVHGFDSTYFAIAAVLALVVMYDAQGVRWEAGNHARTINEIIDDLEHIGFKLDKNQKEILGHTPVQVIAGAVLGLIIALLVH
ncbi:MAG: divergent PAP2 family protein [Streptococcaceae bacterium]|nr:divergent PAP2 family protein [Streptococcaceae bacterium]